MKNIRGLVAIAGASAVLLLGAACINGNSDTLFVTSADAPTTNAPASPLQLPVGAQNFPSTGAPAVSADRSGPAPVVYASTSAMPFYQSTNGQSGIWVSGQDKVAVEPDLVLLSVGVDSTGATVNEANAEASAAIDAIVNALEDAGVADKDKQTTSFNIFPLYEYREEIESGIRRSKQILVGYRFNNSASIKVRDLDSVGAIIDVVVAAGATPPG